MSFVRIGEANRAIHNGTHTDSFSTDHMKHETSRSEGRFNDLTSMVSMLVDRIKDLENSSRTGKQMIHDLGDVILYLESKVGELENFLKKSRNEISSLKNSIHTFEQRNLQLFNGPLTERPIVNIGGGRGSSDDIDDSPCMPRYVNTAFGPRCIFGGTPSSTIFRFENRTIFNGDITVNEDIEFDEDATCMPRYNRTSDQCVMSDNFVYNSGSIQFQPPTKVTFRSREVWIRPKKTFFRNTNTSIQGGTFEIRDDVDVIN